MSAVVTWESTSRNEGSGLAVACRSRSSQLRVRSSGRFNRVGKKPNPGAMQPPRTEGRDDLSTSLNGLEALLPLENAPAATFEPTMNILRQRGRCTAQPCKARPTARISPILMCSSRAGQVKSSDRSAAYAT